MLTTSHGFIAYLCFRRRGPRGWLPGVLGAISPDLPQMVIYLVGGFLAWSQGEFIMNNLQVWAHSLWLWSNVASLFHSFFFWAGIGLLSFCLARRRRFRTSLQIFVLGGLSHIAIDFLTHRQGWVWNYFYPLAAVPIYGPLDYMNWYFFSVEHLTMAIIIGHILRRRRWRRRQERRLAEQLVVSK